MPYISESQTNRNVILLIAEDDDGHAELLRGSLENAGLKNEIIRFKNGLEAWNFLSNNGDGRRRENNQPYLLLLDLRMPKMDGFELLERLKTDSVLRVMPVVMLTTTSEPHDIKKCYELGASAYVVKPVNFDQFTEAIKRLGLFIQSIQVAPLNAKR